MGGYLYCVTGTALGGMAIGAIAPRHVLERS